MTKRSHESAFERRFLKGVKEGGFYVKIDMFKVLKEESNKKYRILTTENNDFTYDKSIIIKRSKSATAYDEIQEFTKTQLIELFANISVNDVWSAEFEKYDESDKWHRDLCEIIQGLHNIEASKFIKENFKSFGKINRRIIGHKVNTTSDNNYYIVRDLEILFDMLEEGILVEIAQKRSIRNLDVNSIQYLIFNGVKYILKKDKDKKIIDNERPQL